MNWSTSKSILFYSYFIFIFFRGSLDCVQLINDEHMVSGADNGWVYPVFFPLVSMNTLETRSIYQLHAHVSKMKESWPWELEMFFFLSISVFNNTCKLIVMRRYIYQTHKSVSSHFETPLHIITCKVANNFPVVVAKLFLVLIWNTVSCN